LNQVKIHEKTVLKTIWSIVLDLEISIILSDSVNETKQLLELLVEHQQTTRELSDSKKRQETLVAVLPGISQLLTKRLLANYQTPLKVFNLSEDQLRATQGIGPEKSKTIFALLNSLYENPG